MAFKAIIDLVLLGILIICVWSGYKKGIIMGVGGILCIIVAVYGANLLANSFSYDVVPALKPFANGYTETMMNGSDSAVMKRMGWDGSTYRVEDLVEMYPNRKLEFCSTCYQTLGFDENLSDRMAEKAVTYARESGSGIRAAVGQILCETVSYAACFLVAFLLILIILTVIGNLPNLSYKLPRFDILNDILGAVLGLITGLMLCAVLVWALRFLGKLIGTDTLASTRIGGWLLRQAYLTRYLGI
jgi:uncharacterized membrane protein required for colicin V production